MRTVSRVHVKGIEVKQELIQLEDTLSIRFQIDKKAIEVWFHPDSEAFVISCPTGYLRVMPRSNNAITVEAMRFDEV